MRRSHCALLAVTLVLGSCQTGGSSTDNPLASPAQVPATIALPPEPSPDRLSLQLTSTPLNEVLQSPATGTVGKSPPEEVPCIDVDFSGQPEGIPPRLVLLDDGLLRAFDFPEEGARILGRQSYIAALTAGNHSASPDARTLAFIESSPDPSGSHEEMRELRLATAFSRLSFSWPETWLYIMGWAADGRLALMSPRTAPRGVTLIDLKTKATQRLQPLLNAPCEWGDGRVTPILYSPDLASIAYPTNVTDTLCDCARCEWALADAESGHIHWSTLTAEWPRWSPDGTRLAITARTAFLEPEAALVSLSPSREPVFLTSPDTDSVSHFPTVIAPTWSPDSRYIAAWAGHYGVYGTIDTFTVIVVDVLTQAVRNYCLQTDRLPYDEPPVWSPDGAWVAVRTWTPTVDYPGIATHLVLLHLESGRAFRLETFMPPIAWLTIQ